MNIFTRPKQWDPSKNTFGVEKFHNIINTCSHGIMFRMLSVLDEALEKMISAGPTSNNEVQAEATELCYLVNSYQVPTGWDTDTSFKRAKELLDKFNNIAITAILNEYKKGNEVLFPEYNIQS